MTRLGQVHTSQLRIEENFLREARIESGFTIKQVCDFVGCSVSAYLNIELGYSGPMYKHTGEIKPYIAKAASLFGWDVFSIFPREFCDTRSGLGLTNEQILDLVHRDIHEVSRKLYNREVFSIIKRALSSRELKIIVMRFMRGFSLREAGKALHVSTERARQIERRALLKLTIGTGEETIWGSK